MQQNLYNKYGFDKTVRQRRIELLGLDRSDHQLAKCLHFEVLIPNLNSITDAFYHYVLHQPELTIFIDSAERLASLKETHREYLKTLGMGFDTEDYFKHRLMVGFTHARIGLPLSYYFAAYRYLTEIIIKHIPLKIIQPGVSSEDLILFINKITSFDMTLAIDVYHESKVQRLVESLDELEGEKMQLSEQVQVDSLTQVSSRLSLMDILARTLAQADADNRPVTIAMLDLDNFKSVNDSYGHLVGDQLLTQVALRILGQVRERDTVGRYGGDEFILVFPETRYEIALQIAERIRQSIDENNFQIDDLSLHSTISIGLVKYKPNESVTRLIERADVTMYEAKTTGRNKVVMQCK
jgi:diguanylate cyclase (GGDEF)-like protein